MYNVGMAKKKKRSFLKAILGVKKASNNLSRSVGKGKKSFTKASFNFFKAQNNMRRF